MEQVEEKGRHNNGILIDIPYQDTQVFNYTFLTLTLQSLAKRKRKKRKRNRKGIMTCSVVTNEMKSPTLTFAIWVALTRRAFRKLRNSRRPWARGGPSWAAQPWPSDMLLVLQQLLRCRQRLPDRPLWSDPEQLRQLQLAFRPPLDSKPSVEICRPKSNRKILASWKYSLTSAIQPSIRFDSIGSLNSDLYLLRRPPYINCGGRGSRGFYGGLRSLA